MTRADWFSVLDRAAACGVREIQFIGGEPTMHPDFADLVDHALNIEQATAHHIDVALVDVRMPRMDGSPRPPQPRPGRTGLTPRERDVLALLARGDTDADIATQLAMRENLRPPCCGSAVVGVSSA